MNGVELYTRAQSLKYGGESHILTFCSNSDTIDANDPEEVQSALDKLFQQNHSFMSYLARKSVEEFGALHFRYLRSGTVDTCVFLVGDYAQETLNTESKGLLHSIIKNMPDTRAKTILERFKVDDNGCIMSEHRYEFESRVGLSRIHNKPPKIDRTLFRYSMDQPRVFVFTSMSPHGAAPCKLALVCFKECDTSVVTELRNATTSPTTSLFIALEKILGSSSSYKKKVIACYKDHQDPRIPAIMCTLLGAEFQGDSSSFYDPTRESFASPNSSSVYDDEQSGLIPSPLDMPDAFTNSLDGFTGKSPYSIFEASKEVFSSSVYETTAHPEASKECPRHQSSYAPVDVNAARDLHSEPTSPILTLDPSFPTLEDPEYSPKALRLNDNDTQDVSAFTLGDSQAIFDEVTRAKQVFSQSDDTTTYHDTPVQIPADLSEMYGTVDSIDGSVYDSVNDSVNIVPNTAVPGAIEARRFSPEISLLPNILDGLNDTDDDNPFPTPDTSALIEDSSHGVLYQEPGDPIITRRVLSASYQYAELSKRPVSAPCAPDWLHPDPSLESTSPLQKAALEQDSLADLEGPDLVDRANILDEASCATEEHDVEHIIGEVGPKDISLIEKGTPLVYEISLEDTSSPEGLIPLERADTLAESDPRGFPIYHAPGYTEEISLTPEIIGTSTTKLIENSKDTESSDQVQEKTGNFSTDILKGQTSDLMPTGPSSSPEAYYAYVRLKREPTRFH